MTLSEAIKAIRKRRGETGVVFARLIGTDQSTVSKYEKGSVVPSRSTLLNVLRLSEGDERPVVLQALGVQDGNVGLLPQSEVDDAMQTFDRFVAEGGLNNDPSIESFVDVAKDVLRGGVDPSVVSILRKWVECRADRRSRQVFKNVEAYLEIELRKK